MIAKHSDRLVYDAVRGMLAKNRLSRKIMRKLFVYKNGNHNHSAQQPTVYQVARDVA